jgi:hypothetical protein
MSVKSRHNSIRILLLVWLIFLLRGLFYCVLFPLWEGYDEYTHFAFIQHLVTNHSLPEAAHTPISKEVLESLKLVPLPWTLRDIEIPHATHDNYWRLPEDERSRRQRQLYQMPRDWAHQPASQSLRHLLNWEAQQPPLYYLLLSLPLRLAWNSSLPGRVMLLRLLSVGLASLVIPLGFSIARRVVGSSAAALGVVALIASMPELMIDICRVSNDSLAIVIYSLVIYAIFEFLEHPCRLRIVALLAVSLGLGLLTKAYFLTALPALVVVLVCLSCFKSMVRRKILFYGFLAVAGALLISGWWYWRNHVLTGSWSGVMPDVALRHMPLWELLRQIPRVDWKNALDVTFLSHIWFGNWSFLQVRSWIYHIFTCLALLSLAGLLSIAVMPLLKRNAQFPFVSSRRHLLVLIAVYAFFWLGLLYHVLITFVAQGISASQGWYLYCLVVAEVLVVAVGLLALVPIRLRPWLLPAATFGFCLLDLYTVHFLLIPYYVGLISHKADGALASFHLGQLRGLNLWEFLNRLVIHKPLVNVPGLLAIWGGYLAATLGLILISLRLGWAYSHQLQEKSSHELHE